MTDNELLQLADREAERLADENDHGAAILMRALARRLREYIAKQKQNDPHRVG